MRTHRTRATVLCASAINIIDPVAVGLVMCSTSQELGLRTDIDLAKGIETKVGYGELRFWFRGSCSRVDAMLEARLFEEAGIALAKLQVLMAQREDLSAAIDALLEDIANGRKYMKVYKQMKMYNDESLNPILYAQKK